MIERGFDFGDLRVDEILVPRLDVVAVEIDTPVRRALDIAVAAGHRRLLVHEGDLDAVVGVVRIRDLAAAVAEQDPRTVEELTRPVLIVPETKRVIDLLREMQSTGRHLATVVDEHGGTAGLVTIEDVAEELVGQVADEGEQPPVLYRSLADGRWEVDARLDVDDLEELLGIELQQGSWHTVGGLVMHLAGRVPSPGDAFPIDGHEMRVTQATTRRVQKLVITQTGK